MSGDESGKRSPEGEAKGSERRVAPAPARGEPLPAQRDRCLLAGLQP
eukprot:SAG31_NODE_8522_length_1437_cov_0.928251_1_plen_46_part_10